MESIEVLEIGIGKSNLENKLLSSGAILTGTIQIIYEIIFGNAKKRAHNFLKEQANTKGANLIVIKSYEPGNDKKNYRGLAFFYRTN